MCLMINRNFCLKNGIHKRKTEVQALPSFQHILILSSPKEFFYNNASECSHFKYKSKILEHNTEKQPGYRNTLQSSWAQAIDIYHKLVVTTSQNVQLCVVDKGPYKLAPLYSHLKISALTWGKRDPEKN